VITAGSADTLIVAQAAIADGGTPTEDGVEDGPGIDYCWRIPVPPVPHGEIVDTNGCGDAFVGGFLSCYLSLSTPAAARTADAKGRLAACAAAGHRCAGVVLRQRGCSLPPSAR
jgi:sugar/nucleoside kinase (ribokinase family)